MNWNPVLNEVIRLKKEYIIAKGQLDYFNCQDTVMKWSYAVAESGNPYYRELFAPLIINQMENLVLFKYGSLTDIYNDERGDFWELYDGFYRECRSVVIDIEKDQLVLTPFKKFRNINECEETSLENVRKRIREAKTVEFSNKLDGSMQSASFYDGRIVMAGSQALDRNQSWRLDAGYSFLAYHSGFCRMIEENPEYTFIFEYISEENAIVVKYNKAMEGLHLIGMRSKETGVELSYADILKYALRYGVRTAEVYNTSLDEVLGSLDSKSADEAEGFVLNIDGWKCKIKYNDYVQIHKFLASVISPNYVIKCIAEGTIDDTLSKVPLSHRSKVYEIVDIVKRYVSFMDGLVLEYYNKAPKSSTRDFMVYITSSAPKFIQGSCIAMYHGSKPQYLKKKGDGYVKMTEIMKILDNAR